MKDRISASPGRVLITPESGASFYATMTRADNPTQEGDSLSKNTLLKDTTAEALGLSDAALPDDALRILSRLHAGLGNEYLWAKVAKQSGIIEGSKTAIKIMSDATIEYSQTINISNETISLNNPNTTYAYEANAAELLDGMYFTLPEGSTTVYKFVSLNMSGVNPEITGIIITYGTTGEVVGYVNSPNPTAYPPAEDDGYTYQALGILGEKVRIATGSYKGTGAYEANNAKTLTFAFQPKLLIIVLNSTSSVQGTLFVYGQTTSGGIGGTTSSGGVNNNIVSWSDNGVTWYSSTSADKQMNASGTTYYYFAIG